MASSKISPGTAALLGVLIGGLLTAMFTPRTGPQFRRYLLSILDDSQQIPEAVEKASRAAQRTFERSLDSDNKR